jgi:superfamily II DNA/RNA helicase
MSTQNATLKKRAIIKLTSRIPDADIQEPVTETHAGARGVSTSSPPVATTVTSEVKSSWEDEDDTVEVSPPAPIKKLQSSPQEKNKQVAISNREQAFPALSRIPDIAASAVAAVNTISNIRPQRFDDDDDFQPSAAISDAKKAELAKQQQIVSDSMGSDDFDEGTTPNLPVITNFDDMGLSEKLLRGIYAFGLEKPSPIQARGIPAFMTGRDLIPQAHSGTGKTAMFSIGTLNLIEKIRDIKNPYFGALIISPTRMLAEQSHGVIKDLGARILPPIKVECFMGGRPLQEDIRAAVGCEIATGTTGRIIDLFQHGKISLKKVKLLVLDEADELLKPSQGDYRDNGQGDDNSFEAHIKIITGAMAKDAQIVIVSATMTQDAMDICNKLLVDPIKILLKPQKLSLKGIRQFNVIFNATRPFNSRNEDMESMVFGMKYGAFNEIFKTIPVGQTIIFCKDVNSCEQLHDAMILSEYQVGILHGKQSYQERKKAITDLKSESIRFMVTTDMAARGFDVHTLSLVINFDMPRGVMFKETYLHRIGRSGRHGRKGVAINMCVKGNTPMGGSQNRNRESSDISKIHDITKHFGCIMEELPNKLEGCL